MNTVAFVVPDRVQLLDVAGPAQVFSTLRDLTGEPSTIVYVGEQQTVQSKQGLPVNVSTDWPGLAPDDLLIIPGFAATAHPLNNNLLASIAAHHAAGGTIASICAGAFIVAEAGLLDGRRATTLVSTWGVTCYLSVVRASTPPPGLPVASTYPCT